MPRKKKVKEEDKEIEVVFAPGCFDDFEGTQEELDALVVEIKAGFAPGGKFEDSIPIDEITDPEILEEFERYMSETGSKRKIQ